MTSDRIRIDRRLATLLLGAIAAFMIAASIVGDIAKHETGRDHLMGFVPKFNLNQEGNISTFFSALLLLLASCLLAVTSFLSRAAGRRSLEWRVLAFAFLLLAFDEAAGFHELLNDPVRGILGEGYNGVFHFAWVLPAAVGLVLLALFLRGFLFSLEVPVRNRMLLSAAVFLSGAVGVETLGGWYAGTHGVDNLAYAMAYTFEEGMEMFGTVIFIGALLHYQEIHFPRLELTFGKDP